MAEPPKVAKLEKYLGEKLFIGEFARFHVGQPFVEDEYVLKQKVVSPVDKTHPKLVKPLSANLAV